MQKRDIRKTIYRETGTTRGSTQKEEKNYTSLWLLIVLIVLTTCIFLIPGFHFGTKLNLEDTWWFDVLQHVFFYLTLSLVLFQLLHFQERSLSFFLFLLSFATFFEVLQKIIYNIDFSWRDTISNFVGLSIAFGIEKWMESKLRKQRKLKRLRQKK